MAIVSEIIWKETIDDVPIDYKPILFYVPTAADKIKTGYYFKELFFCAASTYKTELVPLWANMELSPPKRVKDIELMR